MGLSGPDRSSVIGNVTRGRTERATPPLAQLRLDPGGGAPAVVHRSPVWSGHSPAVALARPEVRATALIRDPDGGTGRIRLTVRWVADCGRERRPRTVHLPPTQIERIRLAPGVLAPVERRRSGWVRLPRGCRVSGEAFADATNASGLESFSDPVRFTVTSPKAGGDGGARSPGTRKPYLGSLGERMRYAFRPSPSRSRSSLSAGSSPLSSFTRSSR